MAANRLTQREDVTVTLINPRSTFVERIRLHQLVGGSRDALVDYREVLGEGIRLVVDTVTRIDAAERSGGAAAVGRRRRACNGRTDGSRSQSDRRRDSRRAGGGGPHRDPWSAARCFGPYLHPRGRRSVAKRLAKLGVTMLEGSDAKVTAVTRDVVQLSGGRKLPSKVTIWTAGFGVPDLAACSGLSTDELGRLLTDET